MEWKTITLPTESAEELYEGAPCGYLSLLPNGIIVRVNQTFLDWTGYTRAELLQGKRFQELLTIPGRIYHDTHYAPLLQMQGFVTEIAFDVRRPSQSPLPVLLNSCLVRDAQNEPLLIRTTVFNATARRQYEYELLLARRKAEHLAAIVQASSDAILSITPLGLVQSWNRGAEQLFGYSAAEAVGRSVEALFIPPARAAEFAHALATLAHGQPMHFESVYCHKDGHTLDVAISLTPLIEAPNDLVSISAILHDIGAAKRTERILRQQSETLAQRNRDLAARNDELDAFVYVASHDLKEPLRGINYYAQFLLEDYATHLPEEGVAMLHALPQLSAHLLRLLDALLFYARLGRQAMTLQPVDAQAVLDEQLYLLHLQITTAQVTVRIPQPLPTVQSDPILLGELFMNLIVNAIKYNDKAEKWVEIGWLTEQEGGGQRAEDRGEEDRRQRTAGSGQTIEGRELDDQKATQTAEKNLSPGPLSSTSPSSEPLSSEPLSSVLFYVRDNGIGIAPHQQEEIFRIFRRLHMREAYGGGAGAGLTIVRRIIERHGGRIWLQSELGQGTTFYFTLS